MRALAFTGLVVGSTVGVFLLLQEVVAELGPGPLLLFYATALTALVILAVNAVVSAL